MSRVWIHGFTASVVLSVVLLPVAASAQASGGPGWWVEVHGAAGVHSIVRGGSPHTQFPTGAEFLMETDPERRPSRAVPSWFFGDGALLVNQVAAQFQNAGGGLQFARITPLDEALGANIADVEQGAGFGIRFGRRLVSRLGVELSVDWNDSSAAFTGATRDAIEQTRASFADTFTDLLDVAPVTNEAVSALADYREGSAKQMTISGAFTVGLGSIGAVSPYVLFGGGIVRHSGSLPEITLRGNYQFRHLGVAPINETDVVTIRLRRRDSSPLAVFGGGVVVTFGQHHGVRLDVRLHATEGDISTIVSAAPSTTAGTPTGVLPSNTTPGIQFSTVNGIRSSLGGAMPETETFSPADYSARVLVSVGYVIRF